MNETITIQIDNLKKQCEAGLRSSTVMREPMRTFDSTPLLGANKLKLKPPRFEGKSKDKPMRVIKDLKKHILITNLNHLEIMNIISKNLEGAASAWFEVTERVISDFDGSVKKFKERFWNE